MTRSRHNDRQLAPGVDDITNHYTTNVVETELAYPARNRLGERGGERVAEEGVWRIPEVAGSFYDATYRADHADVVTVERQIAPNRRSRLASGEQVPSWNAVPQEALDNFAGAMNFGEPGDAYPFPHQPRAGANMQTLTPLDGLARGERQGTVYGKAYAPPNGGRGRRNQADVSGL
jgi:hypothetical protein